MAHIRRNKESFNRFMNRIIFLLVLVILACLAVIGRGLFQYYKGGAVYQELSHNAVTLQEEEAEAFRIDQKEAGWEGKRSVKELPIQVDFSALGSLSEQIQGWLYSSHTPVNYPVMQGEDNSYYLDHLPDGTRNAAGSLFIDCNNRPPFQDDNTIIYGHHMRNNSMFGSLERYRDPAYYQEHPVIYYIQKDSAYRIDLTSCVSTSNGSSVYTLNFASRKEKKAYLEDMQSRSYFQSQAAAAALDRPLVTLSTCAYDTEDARLVLQGIVTLLE